MFQQETIIYISYFLNVTAFHAKITHVFKPTEKKMT